MEKIKKFFIQLLQLSAFKVGFLFTILMTYIAIQYYLGRDSLSLADDSKLSIPKIVNDWHQKTIDMKLLARGERAGSDQVALLTIDEKSIEKLGRWPWPRGIIAETIEQIMENGAKVLAFDVIFNAPDNNQAVLSLNRLKENPQLPQQIYPLIDEELKKANTDLELAQTIKKYADRLVMGTYYDPNYFNFPSHTAACQNAVYSQTQSGKNLETEESPTVVLDTLALEVPEGVLDFLDGKLLAIEEKIKTENPLLEENARNNEIFEKKLDYCYNWLSDNDSSMEELKELWPEIKEDAELDRDFEQWVSFLKANSWENRVELMGKLWMNMPLLSKEVKHRAFFNAIPDPDGTIRRSLLFNRHGNLYLPTISLKSVMLAQNLGLVINIDEDQSVTDRQIKKVSSVYFTKNDEPYIEIPSDINGTIPINYAGPQKMFPYLSIAELFNGKDTAVISQRIDGKIQKEIIVNKKEWIKDKIFIVGATATGIYDLRVTPFEENFPGPETHLNMVDNLLRQDFLRVMPDEAQYMMAGIVIFGILLSFLLSRLGALNALIITIGMLSIIILGDFHFLFKKGYIISIILPVLFVANLYVILTFFKYLTEEKKKKELKGTFQKYVSPAIVDEVLQNPDSLELGGRKEHMTVLFSDIRGFTTMSEQLDPQQLSNFLNSYLTPMTDLVFSNKGTLDKYMGDAVMAFFGAPINYKEHAKMGVKCALNMLERLAVLQKEYKEQNLPPIDIGIGLNTGEMSVGNMGSETVRSYTVMGDAVNLGSRLEGINKQYGTRIIISEFTRKEISDDDFLCREIDWVKVKGKLEPVKIFEVVDFNIKASDEKKKAVSLFQQGFELYHNKQFQEALQKFEEAKKHSNDDGPSLLYIERTQNYIQNPPPDNWDGVFTMTTK